MWSQRDQIQAYQFLRRRLVSGLVTTDPNSQVSPNRRAMISTWIGIGLVLLLVAGFVVAGYLHPKKEFDWRKGGQIISESSSGALYVLGKDQRLHPVLNYASARLLVGADGTNVSASASDLDDAPRGAPLGISGAPQSLPGTDDLTDGPWVSCSSRSADSPADAPPTTSLYVGSVTMPSLLATDTAVVAMDPFGGQYLLTGGKRYRVGDRAVAAALGFTNAVPVPVSGSWLGSVPAGSELRTIAIDGAGGNGAAVGGQVRKIGEVLEQTNVATDVQYFVVRADGVQSVSPFVAALIAADSSSPEENASPPKVTAQDVSIAPKSKEDAITGYPVAVPRAVSVPTGNIALCAIGAGNGQVQLSVSSSLPRSGEMTAVSSNSALVADQIFVAPGTGAVVSTGATSTTPGALYLVTDAATKYPIVSTAAAQALGYGDKKPTPVVASILALLPTGVALDPAAATQVNQQAAR